MLRKVVPSLARTSKSHFRFAHKLVKTVERQKQELALDKENCILVDDSDIPIGYASKRDCHKIDEHQNIKLHRAFSVFLFNTKGEMLIQRRPSHKVVFPNFFSNACCSHPLYNLKTEREESHAYGIRKAAQRRVNHELGIPLNQIRPGSFHYLTRIHYMDKGDGVYGEHEIDYILFLKKDVDLKPNPEEVSEIRWIKHENMDKEISSLRHNLTPWFLFLYDSGKLGMWWNNLNDLSSFEDHYIIHKLK